MPVITVTVFHICGGDDARGNGKIEEGVRVGGELIKDVRFADDEGMVASTEQGLKKVMDGLNEAAKTYDMKINVKKTKVVSREEELLI